MIKLTPMLCCQVVVRGKFITKKLSFLSTLKQKKVNKHSTTEIRNITRKKLTYKNQVRHSLEYRKNTVELISTSTSKCYEAKV